MCVRKRQRKREGELERKKEKETERACVCEKKICMAFFSPLFSSSLFWMHVFF